MRLLILSDLHLDLWRERAPRIDPTISRPDAVVLAGDIHKGGSAVKWAAETFPGLPVIYVSGNHENYGRTLEEAEEEIREECRQHMNVHYLNCDDAAIDGVRFLGCTLWTDYLLFGAAHRWSAMLKAREAMNDYRLIRLRKHDCRTLHPVDTVRIHAQHRAWLERKLAQPFSGKTIVVTHMAPSALSIAPKYETDLTSAAFASRLEGLVAQADLWVHGHMHRSFSYRIEKCRVVCNPCGYMTRSGGTENDLFDSNFVMEV
jgi:predicted phosphodiesterase